MRRVNHNVDEADRLPLEKLVGFGSGEGPKEKIQ